MENNTNPDSNAYGNYLTCLLQLLFYSTKIKYLIGKFLTQFIKNQSKLCINFSPVYIKFD